LASLNLSWQSTAWLWGLSNGTNGFHLKGYNHLNCFISNEQVLSIYNKLSRPGFNR
jgi:hypothetical protein